MYFMPINGWWWGGGGANENKVSMEIRRVLIAKSGGGSRPRRQDGIHWVYSQGEMALCGGDASCH